MASNVENEVLSIVNDPDEILIEQTEVLSDEIIIGHSTMHQSNVIILSQPSLEESHILFDPMGVEVDEIVLNIEVQDSNEVVLNVAETEHSDIILDQLNTSNKEKSSQLDISGKLHQCNLCNYSTNFRRTLELHKRVHKITKEKKYICQKCDKCFRNLQDMKRHMLSHSDEKPFSCDVCSTYKTKYYKSLKAHMLNRHKIRLPYRPGKSLNSVHTYGEKCSVYKTANEHKICEICGTAVKNLYQHRIFVHMPKKFYSCDKCEKKFKGKLDLTRHKETHFRRNAVTERNFVCDICAERFKWKETLRRHKLRMHFSHRIEQFKCQHCNLQCISKAQLNHHMVTHSDDKPFACDKCGYRAKRERNLKAHQKVHNSLKQSGNYFCKQCPFKTNRMEMFAIHQQEHFEKNASLDHQILDSLHLEFQCNICNEQTNTLEELIGHSKNHSADLNKKCYQCNVCKFETEKLSDMAEHKNLHHLDPHFSQQCEASVSENINVFQCSICLHQAKTLPQMIEHNKIHIQSSLTNVKKSQGNFNEALETTNFKCKSCDFRDSKLCIMAKHNKIHIDKSLVTSEIQSKANNILDDRMYYKCVICSYRTVTLDEMIDHNKEHKEKQTDCIRQTDNSMISSNFDCKRRKRKTNSLKKLHCNACSNHFSTLEEMIIHEKNCNTQMKSHTQIACDKTRTEGESLNHSLSASRNEKYSDKVEDHSYGFMNATSVNSVAEQDRSSVSNEPFSPVVENLDSTSVPQLNPFNLNSLNEAINATSKYQSVLSHSNQNWLLENKNMDQCTQTNTLSESDNFKKCVDMSTQTEMYIQKENPESVTIGTQTYVTMPNIMTIKKLPNK